ncbi:MAG: acetyl-CoA synthetase [Deltaproteobacteria bacterium]|nr:MAG: acetyl-CoA synthetase [Deltaproteobacteria bacterium]
MLLNPEAKSVLAAWGIPVVETKTAKSKDEAIKCSFELGFPVAMKINSYDLIHKTDARSVVLNLKSQKEVEDTYNKFMETAKKSEFPIKVEGVIIEKMVYGIECIIGVIDDPQFGHVIMFGTGGIFVEILNDVSFRLIPINEIDAEEMIKEIKGYNILKGYRGIKGDLKTLKNILIKVSNLVINFPEIKEIDLNPIFTSSSSTVVSDARIRIE